MEITKGQNLESKIGKSIFKPIQHKAKIKSFENIPKKINQKAIPVINQIKDLEFDQNTIKNELLYEKTSLSNFPELIDHNEQQIQDKNTESANIIRLEHIKLQSDYKSLLESYNSLSQAFHSHVSLVQSSYFLNYLQELRTNKEKYKKESLHYLEQVQSLLIENHKLKTNIITSSNPNESSISVLDLLKNDNPYNYYLNNPSLLQSLNQELKTAREIIAIQENDIEGLKLELAQMNEFKKINEKIADENSKMNSEIQILNEKKNWLEREMKILIEKKNIQQNYSTKLNTHRELLVKENEFLKETIKELENSNFTNFSVKNYEKSEEKRKAKAEKIEFQRKLLEEKLKTDQEFEDYKQKFAENSEKLTKSEAFCKEVEIKLENFRKEFESLERDKKLKEENLEETNKLLYMLREELEVTKAKTKIFTQESLVKLVELLHKSSKVWTSS